MSRTQRRRLHHLLVDEGLVSRDDVAAAQQIQGTTGESLGAILVDMDCLSALDLARSLTSHFQLPFICLRHYDRDTKLVQLFPTDFLHQHKIFPFDSIGRMLLCAVTEIPEDKVLAEIPRITKHKVALYAGLLEEIERCLQEACPLGEDSEFLKRRRHLGVPRKGPSEATPGEEGAKIFAQDGGESLTDALDSTWDSIFEAVETQKDSETTDA